MQINKESEIAKLFSEKHSYMSEESLWSQNNTDIVVDLSYDNPSTMASGGPDVIDPRYVRVRMQHSFLEMPKNDFRARRDDPRVGYFMQQRTDMTSIGVTPYKDMINRWFLKKKDPTAANE